MRWRHAVIVLAGTTAVIWRPGAAVLLVGLVSLSVWRVCFEPQAGGSEMRGDLPEWPISPRTRRRLSSRGRCTIRWKPARSPAPSYLVIPERDLYTGVLIFGVVGSGKTSACLHPFPKRILS